MLQVNEIFKNAVEQDSRTFNFGSGMATPPIVMDAAIFCHLISSKSTALSDGTG